MPLFACFILNCNFEHLYLCTWPLTFAFVSVEPEITVMGHIYQNLNHTCKAQAIDNIASLSGEVAACSKISFALTLRIVIVLPVILSQSLHAVKGISVNI